MNSLRVRFFEIIYLREIGFHRDIFSWMTHIQTFSMDKFLQMLVDTNKWNKKNDSFIKTYAWNKAWRSNPVIKIITNEIIKGFYFLLKISRRHIFMDRLNPNFSRSHIAKFHVKIYFPTVWHLLIMILFNW